MTYKPVKKMPLLVLCNANAEVGFGHFFRCLCIVNEWQSITKESAVWHGDIDAALHPLCDKVVVKPWHESVSDVLYKAPSVLLCDSYLLAEDLATQLCSRHNTIVIDDFGSQPFENAAVVLNFTVAANSYRYASKHQLLGPEYFLCNPLLDKVREQNILGEVSSNDNTNALRPDSANILVAMGGHDRHQVGGYLAIKLAHAYPSSQVVLLGKYSASLTDTLPHNVQHIAVTDRMDLLYHSTNLVISGGGLIKYESAYCGIVNVVLAQTDEQFEESKQFHAYSLCEPYGLARDLQAFPLKNKEINDSEESRENIQMGTAVSGGISKDALDDFLSWLSKRDFDELQSQVRLSSSKVFNNASSSSVVRRLLSILG